MLMPATLLSAVDAEVLGRGGPPYARPMQAGLVTGHRQFELVEMATPVAQPGTAVVDVHLCGVCGTDVHGYLGHTPYNPAICGHEFVGTVSSVGEGVRGLTEGERVVAAVAAPCGRCSNCRAGRGTYCSTAFLGMVGRDPLAPPHGGFAKQVAMDATRLIAVPTGLTDVQGAIVEPTTVALHAVRRTPIPLGATVIVQGCGPIGLLTLQVARAHGAGRVVAIDLNPTRRATALAVGADEALSPDEARDAFGKHGADMSSNAPEYPRRCKPRPTSPAKVARSTWSGWPAAKRRSTRVRGYARRSRWSPRSATSIMSFPWPWT
jgi:threonine dehydrogenase-like Zn-dependent dehydrogenase